MTTRTATTPLGTAARLCRRSAKRRQVFWRNCTLVRTKAIVVPHSSACGATPWTVMTMRMNGRRIWRIRPQCPCRQRRTTKQITEKRLLIFIENDPDFLLTQYGNEVMDECFANCEQNCNTLTATSWGLVASMSRDTRVPARKSTPFS